jgi:hypothetical protein
MQQVKGGCTPAGANQVSNNNEGGFDIPQLSKRQRKNPALKGKDFLW